MPVVTDFTALLSGSYWTGIEVTGRPAIVTYSFPTTIPAYDIATPGFTAGTVASVQPFTAAEQVQARQALGEWAAASGLVFLEVAPGQGDINFQNADFSTLSSPSGAGGIGFYPFGNWDYFSHPYFSDDLDAAGEIFMNSQYLTNGEVNYGTLLHEIGHAIGLKHPTETDVYSADGIHHDQVLASDDPSQTVMATVGDGTPGSDVHLKALDQQAAAAIYGAAGTGGVYTASATGTNAISSWSFDASAQTVTQTGTTGDDDIRGTSVTDVIYGLGGNDKLFGLAGNDTLYGGDGNDSLYSGSGPGADTLVGGADDDSYYVSNVNAKIVEDPGAGYDWVYATVDVTLSANVDALSLYGTGLTGTGNDDANQIYGDGTYASTLRGGGGNDYIVGGAGNDTIEGGTGIDLMYGQGGADIFKYTSISDAPVGSNRDTIADFTRGEDRIDLSGIQAVSGSSSHQPFTFIGETAFTHHAGELHTVISGGDTIVEGDVDGDGAADFQIELGGVFTGSNSLQTSDFILTAAAPCYCTGTLILTSRGEGPVEALAVGDLVVTASGEQRPIEWIGYRRTDIAHHPEPIRVMPVRFKAGAIAPGVPARDLRVSPDHAVSIEGVLVKASRLVNGVNITRENVPSVTYWHVELDSHDLLVADGMAAESYLESDNRQAFDNGGAVVQAHPDFAAMGDYAARTCMPLVEAGEQLKAIRAGLFARISEHFTTDPDIAVLADGIALRPATTDGRHFRFDIPEGTTSLRLVSRSAMHSDVQTDSRDHRCFGVLVRKLMVDGIEADYDALGDGWLTQAPGRDHRWTNGNAALPHGRSVAFQTASLERYPLAQGLAKEEALRAA